MSEVFRRIVQVEHTEFYCSCNVVREDIVEQTMSDLSEQTVPEWIRTMRVTKVATSLTIRNT